MSESPSSALNTFKSILLDPREPNCLVHFVPLGMWDKLSGIPQQFLVMSTDELRDLVKPGLTLDSVRTSFWVEYNAAISSKRKMVIDRVYGGICSNDFFYHRILFSNLFMAWMLLPPENYQASLQTMLARTTERMYDIINLPFITQKGTIDARVIQTIYSVHKHLEDRTQGAVVQHIETRNLNVNVNKDLGEHTDTELEKRIKELRNREQKAIGDNSGSTIEAQTSVAGD